MAILGDFAFYAGKPSEDLIRFKPESCEQDFIIMVPQNEEWARLIEKCYGDKAKKVTRYAIKKAKNIFDVCKLEMVNIRCQYEIVLIFHKCKQIAVWFSYNDIITVYKNLS